VCVRARDCVCMCVCMISTISLPLIALLSYSGFVIDRLYNSNFADA